MGKANTRQNFKIALEANLRLAAGKIILGELKNGENSPQTPWAALGAANQIFTENPESLVLVSFYDEIRTFFKNNF